MDIHKHRQQRVHDPIEGGQLSYHLYIPPDISEVRKWPILCFLHGANEAAKNLSGKKQEISAIMKHGSPPWHCEINSPLVRDFIVLSPQRSQRGYWDQQDFNEIQKILMRINDNFNGDQKRTFLTGFDFGGKGVFDFANWNEKIWAALWPVDPYGESQRSCDVSRIWFYSGSWGYWHEERRNTITNLQLLDAGTFQKDHPKKVRLFSDLSPHEQYDHNATCTTAYADWRVYNWLLK